MTYILEKWIPETRSWKPIAEQGRDKPILDMVYATIGMCWDVGDRIRVRDTLKLVVVWDSHK